MQQEEEEEEEELLGGVQGKGPRGGAVLAARVSPLVRPFGVAEDADGEVFDVGGPLRRQLEKLDVVPLDAVDQH